MNCSMKSFQSQQKRLDNVSKEYYNVFKEYRERGEKRMEDLKRKAIDRTVSNLKKLGMNEVIIIMNSVDVLRARQLVEEAGGTDPGPKRKTA